MALVLGIGLAGCSTTGSAQSPGSIGLLDLGPTTKYAAYVVDANSGSALYQVNATASRYPASLTKMMTLYILFEALQQGRLTKQTQLPVSAYARCASAD